jgi:hypothetical protein
MKIWLIKKVVVPKEYPVRPVTAYGSELIGVVPRFV